MWSSAPWIQLGPFLSREGNQRLRHRFHGALGSGGKFWKRLCGHVHLLPASCAKVLSRVWLCNPWTVAHQAPLSMGFSRQESWSGLPSPSPGRIFPTQGSNQHLLCLPNWGVHSLPLVPPGKPLCLVLFSNCVIIRLLFHLGHPLSTFYGDNFKNIECLELWNPESSCLVGG